MRSLRDLNARLDPLIPKTHSILLPFDLSSFLMSFPAKLPPERARRGRKRLERN